ncbi:MAG: hypothetical protein LC793_18515 [Thermomicrobia bacterium]|nr:hypothetical protein [Thermomicrobia bacterium]
MPDSTRTKPVYSYTLKPENGEFIRRLAAHRELSASRLADIVIEFYRQYNDPTFRSYRRSSTHRNDL